MDGDGAQRELTMHARLRRCARALHDRAGTVAACILFFATSCAPPDVPGVTPDLPASLPCREVVLEALNDWRAGPVALGAPPPAPGGLTLRFPTPTPGEWVIVEAPPVGPPMVALATPSLVTARLHDLSCRWEERTVPRPSTASGAGPTFTDADLRAAIDASEGGTVIVYAWAPHMPLSVDGYPEVVEAARALGADLIPLLVGYSDLEFARREALRVGIPTGGLREVDANELVMRDLQLHAPSILVFSAGRIAPVLPGYRDAAGYRRYLVTLLGDEDR